MPPIKEPRPQPEQVADMVKRLSIRLDETSTTQRTEGRVVLRRLNRVEYENTLRDLFNVDVSVKEMLPEDTVSHGFDNVGASLNTSPIINMAKDARLKRAIREFRQDFTVFSGLSHPEVDGGHPAELCYLTSAPHPRADNFKNTISLDQYAIEQLVPDTRFGSLVLASSSSRGLSFTRSGVPIPAEERPSRVFKSMFVDGTPREIDAQVRRLKQGQSTMARTPSNWLNFALSKSSRCSCLESCSRSLKVPARQEVLCLTERSYFSAETLVTQAATTTRTFQSSLQGAAFNTVNTSPLTQRKTHLFAISTCSSSVV